MSPGIELLVHSEAVIVVDLTPNLSPSVTNSNWAATPSIPVEVRGDVP